VFLSLAVIPLAIRDEPNRFGPGETRAKLKGIGRFHKPVYVTQPPGNSRLLFVVERRGRIQVLRDGRRLARPFLDISQSVLSANEQGLFSVAFPPTHAQTGLFYVAYTDLLGTTRVQEYRRSSLSPLVADPASARDVLRIPQPLAPIHKGGLLLFGPDGLLYIGIGDGGPRGDPRDNGQSRNTLKGKLLRIDPRPGPGRFQYTVPADNPFVGRRGRDEIYALGLRNPWRFSFDRRTGALAIGDVGQDLWEEVNFTRAGAARGANFGWAAFEGPVRFKGYPRAPRAVPPVLAYPHQPACAVTGGYVVRDQALRGSLYGRYVYGDFCTGKLRSFRFAGGEARDDRPLGLRVKGLSSFGQDNAGHVYATSLLGPVYRFVTRDEGK
jgi:glucose/arabinose dehydrogenase